MKEYRPDFHIEPRWPVALSIIIVIFLLVILPERIRLFPIWFPYVAGIIVLLPMVGITISSAKSKWLVTERIITRLFFVFVCGWNLAGLKNLISAMVHRPEDVTGIQLLTSSTAIWVTNVLLFSLLYWQIDRGGPEARVNNIRYNHDWLFPQADIPEEIPSDWCPQFIDYLSLGYSTATAFSPTDTLPLTPRAKLLMIFESTISLMTMIFVISRAINILGT
jgi:hypothetical protein